MVRQEDVPDVLWTATSSSNEKGRDRDRDRDRTNNIENVLNISRGPIVNMKEGCSWWR